MKTLWRTLKTIELFQSKDFEIIFELKVDDYTVSQRDKRIVNYELRQKNNSNQQYKWSFSTRFNSIDEARSFIDEFLEKNFILCPFE